MYNRGETNGDNMNILDNCTQAQREAITYVDGPLMILAAAGSGKTRVITRRVAHMISTGIPAQSILAITFTNKAAEEMKNRVRDLVGETGAWVSTFHSMCARILRRDVHHLGISNDFTIYDEDDARAVIRRAMDDLNFDKTRMRPAQVKSLISHAKNEGITPSEFASTARDPFYKAVAKLYERYEQVLHAGSCLDFDDLLIFVVRLFKEHSDVLERYSRRFQHVCVDEFQDTNNIQYTLARQLASYHGNLCAVGDPDQTIYTWRGATIDNIFDFEKDFPDAAVIKLEENFRSTKSILRAANGVIKHNIHRKDKDLMTNNEDGVKVRKIISTDEKDEAVAIAGVVADMASSGGMNYSDISILYRTNAQSRPIEQVFIERGIPYAIVGAVEFFRRKEIKDVIAFLRLILNPGDDVSFLRTLALATRGIGPVAVARLEDMARTEVCTLAELVMARRYEGAFSGNQSKALDAYAAILNDLRAMPKDSVKDIVEAVLAKVDFAGKIRQIGDLKTDDRLENLDELTAAALEYDTSGEEGNLQGFLEMVALVSDTDNIERGTDRVTLMTLHSAKGLEFPAVVITGLEEGVLPHVFSTDDPKGVEEERRLFFVGMTRAMRRLVLTMALRRIRQGRYADSEPSRFLAEIPPEAMEEPAPFTVSSTLRPGAPIVTRGFEPGINRPIKAKDSAEEYGFQVGDYVRHEDFGTGKVLKMFRSGSQARARIFFPQYGERTLALQYANLQVVTE